MEEKKERGDNNFQFPDKQGRGGRSTRRVRSQSQVKRANQMVKNLNKQNPWPALEVRGTFQPKPARRKSPKIYEASTRDGSGNATSGNRQKRGKFVGSGGQY